MERQSGLVLDEDHAGFSVVRQIHLWTSLKHEPESTKQQKLSPVGLVTKEGIEYQESYLITRLRPQRCRPNSHMQRHTAEKPYQCTECPKDFRTTWELDQHQMVHTEERPHSCEVPKCKSAFKTSKELAAHGSFQWELSCWPIQGLRRCQLSRDLRG